MLAVIDAVLRDMGFSKFSIKSCAAHLANLEFTGSVFE